MRHQSVSYGRPQAGEKRPGVVDLLEAAVADPVITDHFRATWTWKGISGLPEDHYVNSFCFRNDIIGVHPGERIADTLEDFYGGVHAPATSALSQFIPEMMVSATAEVRVYDLGAPAPREPEIYLRTMTAMGTNTPLPSECASCLSFVAGPNTPRTRGRIYLGPLSSGAMGTVSAGHLRPSASMQSSMVQAATWLMGGPNDITWCLLSQADASAKVITGGWVDDAFDTQRRRGGDPTARVSFGTEV